MSNTRESFLRYIFFTLSEEQPSGEAGIPEQAFDALLNLTDTPEYSFLKGIIRWTGSANGMFYLKSGVTLQEVLDIGKE